MLNQLFARYLSVTYAQVSGWRSWSFGELAIAFIVIIAVCAIVWIFVKQSKIPVPPWLVNVFWVVVAAFVCIAAIKLLVSM